MYELTQPVPKPSNAEQAVYPVENDETLSRLIALFLHNRLFNGSKGSTSLRQMGWEESLLTEMSSMPINDVAKILGSSTAGLGVTFDHRKAAAVVRSYRALKRDENDLDYFILNGATPALIRKLFPKVSARVVTAHRKQLGCESKGGRPPLPDTETVYAIYRFWKNLCASEQNQRVRFRRLKEHFPSFTLATLCAAIDSN